MDSCKRNITIRSVENIHEQITTDCKMKTLERKIGEATGRIGKSGADGDYDKTYRECRELYKLLKLRGWLLDHHRGDGTPVYVVDSLFLWDCFDYLKGFQSEAVHFVTGPEVDGNFFMTRLVRIKMSERTWVGAVGDIRDTHQLLQDLERCGYRLISYFHTHPGRGASSTFPSGIDLSMQKGLEKGGYPAIGAIFSQDGYVRFFSAKREFEVRTYGKRVIKKGTNLFLLIK